MYIAAVGQKFPVKFTFFGISKLQPVDTTLLISVG